VDQAREETAMVLAACHSLVVVQDDESSSSTPTPPPIAGVMLPGENTPSSPVSGPTLVGDPIELAAMKSVGWRWDANSSTAFPGNFEGNFVLFNQFFLFVYSHFLLITN